MTTLAPPCEVLPFTSGDFANALSNRRLSPTEVERKPMTKYLVDYLNEISAKTMVVENQYVDGDYLDDFAAYYVKCFSDYDRFCKRLHFFTQEITTDQFVQIVRSTDAKDQDKQAELVNNYLGFIVVRPLPEAIIGRTVLMPYSDDAGRRQYPCTKLYTANLFGIDLNVRSLVFQEQDTVLAACATVALWCSFHKTRDLFGVPSPTPAEITRSTSHLAYQARPIPSHGLNVQQVCAAIRHIGLEPEVVQVREDTPLVSLIYGYLSMGLPVILAVRIEGRGVHAVTITGYSIVDTQVNSQEVAGKSECAPMVGLRVDKFYAHDDQIGPFARLNVKPSANVGNNVYPITFDGTWQDAQSKKYLAIYPLVVIVPVYHKIRLTFLDVHKWIYRFNGFLSLMFPSNTNLEWDIHLTTTNEYKISLKQEGKVKDTTLQEVLLKQHPKYIWRSKLSLDGTLLLEVLADATDMARSFAIYQIIWYEDAVMKLANQLLSNSKIEQRLVSILTQRFYAFLKTSTA
jgi:hypothetical protein